MAKKKPDRMTEISKYLCLILRHKPGIIGGELDEHGYMDVDTLVQGVREKYPEFDYDLLIKIVTEDNKGRYSFEGRVWTQTKIRCNQGHSVKVDLELELKKPPMFLYHGTTEDKCKLILPSGILKMSRHHVHLSRNKETAAKVAERRKGKPVVLVINSGKMFVHGYKFYLSKNGVWLTDYVPPEYIVGTAPVMDQCPELKNIT